jgi:hypothetical protein
MYQLTINNLMKIIITKFLLLNLVIYYFNFFIIINFLSNHPLSLKLLRNLFINYNQLTFYFLI